MTYWYPGSDVVLDCIDSWPLHPYLHRQKLVRNKVLNPLIRPLLEYAGFIWDNCTQKNKYELEQIQSEAIIARTSTGITKLILVASLYKENGWETLDARRNKHKLVLFYKVYNGLIPPYLSLFVPPLVQNAITYKFQCKSDFWFPYYFIFTMFSTLNNSRLQQTKYSSKKIERSDNIRKQQTRFYWVCSWELIESATILMPTSTGLIGILFSISTLYSWRTRMWKISTLYRCTGRSFTNSTQ